MSVEKFNRNFEDLFNWDTSEQPTTEQEYQNAVKNWTQTEMNLVDTVLWQPETAYSVGNIAKTPSLPSQYILVCTEAGDSGVAEPDYTGVSVGDTVVDGTATWLVSTIANGGNIDALTTAVEANTQAIGEHSTAIAENTANVATNTENIATNAENIATNTADIANNTTDIDIAEKRISNIEKLLQGNLYDYQTDSTSAYTKTVLAGAMPYASLDSIGGRTIVMNQLISIKTSDQSKTENGITMVDNRDGTYTLSGTASGGNFALNLLPSKTWDAHKYLIAGCPPGGSNSTYRINLYGQGANVYDTGSGVIWNVVNSTARYKALALGVLDGTAISTPITFKPIFVDLTLMFGAGNEPTTVEQFREMFPAEYYPYNAGELLSAGVTEVVSKKADTSTIATYSVPAEIQALDGYGWSAGSVYNYIDYERKVFVQNVGRLHYDSTGWTLRNTQENGIKTYSRQETSVTNFNAGYISNAVKIKASGYSAGYVGGVACMYDVGTGVAVLSTGNYVYLNTTDISNTDLNIYYVLATPIETDISEYLTDDNLVEVESGGTLTFPNSNGDDYRINVPSSETYMINLQEAVSNG